MSQGKILVNPCQRLLPLLDRKFLHAMRRSRAMWLAPTTDRGPGVWMRVAKWTMWTRAIQQKAQPHAPVGLLAAHLMFTSLTTANTAGPGVTKNIFLPQPRMMFSRSP